MVLCVFLCVVGIAIRSWTRMIRAYRWLAACGVHVRLDKSSHWLCVIWSMVRSRTWRLRAEGRCVCDYVILTTGYPKMCMTRAGKLLKKPHSKKLVRSPQKQFHNTLFNVDASMHCVDASDLYVDASIWRHRKTVAPNSQAFGCRPRSKSRGPDRQSSLHRLNELSRNITCDYLDLKMYTQWHVDRSLLSGRW